MARLTVTRETSRSLMLRSRNKCAFPECSHPIINDQHVLVGELCHIEAAEPGGPRFNPNQTDDERRSFDNLVYLCHAHHKITDDTSTYTVEKLKHVKQTHEAQPPSAYNPDALVKAIDRLEERNRKLQEAIEQNIPRDTLTKIPGYKIVTNEQDGPWLPEQGKFYQCGQSDGSTIRFMAKDQIVCVEQTFPDGAVAYYEVNEHGSVSENRFPYPLSTYKVKIPHGMIVRQERQTISNGTRVTYVLKWGRSVACTHDKQGLLQEVELRARSRISHKERVIEILTATSNS